MYTDIEGQLSIMSNCSRLATNLTDHEVDMVVEDAVQNPDDLVSLSAIENGRGSPDPELQSLSGRSFSKGY